MTYALTDPKTVETIAEERPTLNLLRVDTDDNSATPSNPAHAHCRDDGGPQKQADFPEPQSLTTRAELVWNADGHLADNGPVLGEMLARAGDIYRQPGYCGGLMLASPEANIPPRPIATGSELASIIVDRVRASVVSDGEQTGTTIPVGQLSTLLKTEIFLQQFRPVDQVTAIPFYLPDFQLTACGYNDGGRGHRIIYFGQPPQIKEDAAATQRFLDAMDFASNADKTNAVAAALTVMLRNFFPGGKPLIAVTGNKSHCGKDTIVQFATGRNRLASVSYQSTDWALERAFVGAVKHSPDTAVVNIENARLGAGDKVIASGFLERFLCDPEPTLFSTGSGAPVRRKNDFVIATSTNYGALSTDLLNRCLPVHLELVGSLENRKSDIGNPKCEYLPKHCQEIESELRGMIQRWKEAGCPLDMNVKHPFSEWASTIGGILNVNGFEHFLANYSIRRTLDDPLRYSLGLLGAARPDQWLRSGDWAALAADVGVVDRIIPRADRGCEEGRKRGIGVVFSAHRDETFHGETEGERLTLRLERARRHFEKGVLSKRYCFVVTDREPIPVDPDELENSGEAI